MGNHTFKYPSPAIAIVLLLVDQGIQNSSLRSVCDLDIIGTRLLSCWDSWLVSLLVCETAFSPPRRGNKKSSYL